MKTVRLENNVVREVIPDYALPVEKFYGAEFAAQCVEAPDEVDQHWILNEDGTWTDPATIEPEEPAPAEIPVTWDALAQAYNEGVNLA